MSGRDVTAGVLVAAAVAAWLLAGDAFATTRITALVVTVFGVAACLVGGWWLRSMADPFVVRPLAALGLLAALTAVIALITGSAAALTVLVLLTVGLWVLATVHHAGVRRR